MAIDLQKLRKEYVFAGKGTPAELLADLPKIQDLLKSIKTRQILMRSVAVGVGVLGLAGVVYSTVFIYLGIGGAIGIFVWASKLNAVLKNAQHYGVAEDILQKLSYDTSPRGRFQITVRLKDERKLMAKQPHRGGEQCHYLNPWLDVQGIFLDGTMLTENITDLLRERKRKNANGKTKTKSRSRHIITLRLSYPAGRYGNATPVALKLRSTFRLPTGAVVKAFKPSPKSLAVKALAHEGTDLRGVQDALLLGSYRILNLARQEAARSRK